MLRLGALLLLASVSSPLAVQPNPFIGTIAGGGPDDVPALQATLAYPRAVAAAPGGGFVIGTANNVYRIDNAGRLKRIAGNGSLISSGDGGTALEAGLEGVDGIAVDASGNIYISSAGVDRVRRIDAATGIITTVAGPGQFGQQGDGGPAVDAHLSNPLGLAFDTAGNLYIADATNCSVRRVDTKTGIISTVVGSAFQVCLFNGDGTPALGNGVGASDVAFDPAGNLLVAGFTQIFRVDKTSGLMYRVAGTGFSGNTGDGGQARDARLEVARFAVDPAGNIYLSSYAESRIRRIDAVTGIISTIAGDGIAGSTGDGGPASQARLNRAVGLTFDSTGGLLVSDSVNHRVRRIGPQGAIITTVAGRYDAGDGLPAPQVPMVPRGLATDAAGNVYIADGLFNRVRRVDASTGILTTVAGNGSFIDSGDDGPATEAGLFPVYLAIDATGNLFIGDTFNRRVRRVDAATGVITSVLRGTAWGCQADGLPAAEACLDTTIKGLAVDAAGNLFVGDGLSQAPEPPPDVIYMRIRRFDAATGAGTTIAQAAYGVVSVALDPAGNLFFGDTGFLPEWTDWQHFGPQGNGIWRRDAVTGARTRVMGSGLFGFAGDGGPALQASMTWPRGLTLDGSGNLFIADSDNNRIRRVDAATGIVTTIAGDGVGRFRGDGGLASAASLSSPWGLAINGAGDLLVADTGNGRVRILTNSCDLLPPAISLTVEPAELWPPNHRLVEVTVSAQSSCASATPALTSLTSSEADDASGGGDGNTTDDIQDANPGTDDRIFKLRAERSSGGTGRVYTATYTATDSLGRTATATAVVSVPHDRRGSTDPLDISLVESPAGTIVQWTSVEGAFSYDVVRGALGHIHESANDLHMGDLLCVEAGSTDTTTQGLEDSEAPAPGDVFFYLVEYEDASGRSSFGEEGAAKPRDQSSGGCK